MLVGKTECVNVVCNGSGTSDIFYVGFEKNLVDKKDFKNSSILDFYIFRQ